jgi:hypothetical protein
MNALLPGILQRPNVHPALETFLQNHPNTTFEAAYDEWRHVVFKLPNQPPEALVNFHVMGNFSGGRSGIPSPFVSITDNVVALLTNADIQVLSIVNTVDSMVVLSIPSDLDQLFRHPRSYPAEGEILFFGSNLSDYVVEWRSNPYRGRAFEESKRLRDQ